LEKKKALTKSRRHEEEEEHPQISPIAPIFDEERKYRQRLKKKACLKAVRHEEEQLQIKLIAF